MATSYVLGEHPTRGMLYAAVDPAALCQNSQIAERRFVAFMTPYKTVEEAEAALIDAGAAPTKGRKKA